jgi:hypothetical protein
LQSGRRNALTDFCYKGATIVNVENRNLVLRVTQSIVDDEIGIGEAELGDLRVSSEIWLFFDRPSLSRFGTRAIAIQHI